MGPTKFINEDASARISKHERRSPSTAIARVNCVFRDKPGGLVVDYLGLADQLKHALANYTESGGKGDPTYDTKQAIAVMLEKHGIACDMLHDQILKPENLKTLVERLALGKDIPCYLVP